jgi:hypothetical protein
MHIFYSCKSRNSEKFDDKLENGRIKGFKILDEFIEKINKGGCSKKL